MNLTVSQSQGKPGDSITISWQTTADGGTLSITDGQNTQDITGQASGSVTWALNAPAGGKQYYHCTQQGDTLIDEAYATVSVIADAPPAATTAAPASSSASSNSTPAATTTANSSPASSGPSTPAATTTSNQSSAPPASATTAAPASTPGATTTLAPASSTPGATTTAAPGASAGAPSFDSPPTLQIDPDDGTTQNPPSYQVATNATLTLSWSASGASGVSIDPLGDFPASGSTVLPGQDAVYTMVPKASDGTAGQSFTVTIGTHNPGDVVSGHSAVGSGVAQVISFNAVDAQGNAITSASSGQTITLVLVVSDGADAAQIDGQSAALTEQSDGTKQATLPITISGPLTGDFTCAALQGGATADTGMVHVDLSIGAAPGASTTLAPAGNTTAAPGATTTAAVSASVAAPTLTLSAQPLFGKPGDDCTVSWTMDPPDTPGKLSLTDGSTETDVSGQTQVVWQLNAAPGAKQYYHLVHYNQAGTQDAEAFADPVEIAAADPTDATGAPGAATGSDGPEITIVEQVDTWKKELSPEGAQVEVAITLELQGAVVWSGADADKPSADDAIAQAKAAAESTSNANLEVPLAGGIGSPTVAAGGDFSAFSSEYTNKKKGGETEFTFAEKELFTITFQSPGYQNPTITIPVTAAVATINLSEPLDSALGVLSGSVELTLVAGRLPIVGTQLAVTGGLVVALGVSTQLATFGSILKDAGIDVAEDAGLDAVFQALLEAAGTERRPMPSWRRWR